MSVKDTREPASCVQTNKQRQRSFKENSLNHSNEGWFELFFLEISVKIDEEVVQGIPNAGIKEKRMPRAAKK